MQFLQGVLCIDVFISLPFSSETLNPLKSNNWEELRNCTPCITYMFSDKHDGCGSRRNLKVRQGTRVKVCIGSRHIEETEVFHLLQDALPEHKNLDWHIHSSVGYFWSFSPWDRRYFSLWCFREQTPWLKFGEKYSLHQSAPVQLIHGRWYTMTVTGNQNTYFLLKNWKFLFC